MFKKKKSLGQNFLKSKGVVSHIISASKIKKGDFVVEVGPGQGFLTEDLIQSSGNVLSIEKDDRLIDELKDKFAENIEKEELTILHGDILKFSTDRHPSEGWDPRLINNLEKHGSQTKSGMTCVGAGMTYDDIGMIKFPYKVVANIPYYITGQIIRKFLTAKNKPALMTVMVQKEVADRIVGLERGRETKKESLLSLSVKLFGEPKYIKTVKKNLFSPAPKVDSAILLIDEIKESPFDKKEQEVLFFELIRKAFNQKRKKIGTSLKHYETQLKRSGIDVNKRPEDIKLKEWIKFVKEV